MQVVWYCNVLYCIVMYCNVLYCIVLYCIVLYCIVEYFLENDSVRTILADIGSGCISVPPPPVVMHCPCCAFLCGPALCIDPMTSNNLFFWYIMLACFALRPIHAGSEAHYIRVV